jgi:hypothetical protein
MQWEIEIHYGSFVGLKAMLRGVRLRADHHIVEHSERIKKA